MLNAVCQHKSRFEIVGKSGDHNHRYICWNTLLVRLPNVVNSFNIKGKEELRIHVGEFGI